MPIRRTRRRRSRLQFGPTSRTRDSVWFLFPCRDFEPAANLSKLIVDSSRRFPLGIFLQQSTSVKSSFVIPNKLAPLVRPPFVFQNLVKCRKRAGSITFLFQAQSLFEERLVAPVDRRLFIGG